MTSQYRCRAQLCGAHPGSNGTGQRWPIPDLQVSHLPTHLCPSALEPVRLIPSQRVNLKHFFLLFPVEYVSPNRISDLECQKQSRISLSFSTSKTKVAENIKVRGSIVLPKTPLCLETIFQIRPTDMH